MDKLSTTLYIFPMQPLMHPSMEDVTVEGILHALSDPVRVAIFTQIATSEGAQNCSNFLQVRDKTVPKSTLSQHFRVLRESGLIRSERRGVEMQNSSRCKELNQRFPGLIEAIVSALKQQSGAKVRSGSARARKVDSGVTARSRG